MPQNRIELNRWRFTLDQNEYGESAGWVLLEYDDSRWIEVDSYTSWETHEYLYEVKATGFLEIEKTKKRRLRNRAACNIFIYFA